MGYILNMTEDKRLILSRNTTTYVGENNADSIKIFLPTTFRGYDLKKECKVLLCVMIPNTDDSSDIFGNTIELDLTYSDEHDRYVSYFPIENIYTQKEQIVILKIEILNSSEMIAYSSEVSFKVYKHNNMNSTMDEAQIGIFEQYIFEMINIRDEFEQELTEDVAVLLNKIVDSTTSQKGIVQLSDTVEDDSTKAATPKAVNSIKSIAQTASTTASNADIKSTEALSTANEASTAAGNAETSANEALAAANDAVSKADEANTSASTANTTAQTAKTTAESASATATTAKETADAASVTANEAKTTAESKTSVIWVEKGESPPTEADANSLCFRIL